MKPILKILLAITVIIILNAVPVTGVAAQNITGNLQDEIADEQTVAEELVDDENAEAVEEEEEELSDFEAAIEDREVIEGLFTFYRSEEDGSVLMKIMPDQLDVIYLVSPTMDSGSGEKGMWGAMMWYEKPIVFHKEPGMIQLIEINTRFRADDERTTKLLERMYSNSIIASVTIEAEDEETEAILIDLGTIFIDDFMGFAADLEYQLDYENSKFTTLKAFPRNVNIGVELAFTTDIAPASLTLPDARSMRVGFFYDISERPDTGYMPRYADNRVGYFTTTFKDFTDDRDPDRFKRYAQRWHLEKKYPYEQMSPPKEPIVYWLENTVPEQYREALTEGILMWNVAYEAIGIKDAIVVKQMPDDADWDPADVRYSTIRWYSAIDAGFAIGPSRVDPFTGQIYDADIGVSIDMPYGNFVNYLTEVGIIDDTEPLIPSGDRFDPIIEQRLNEISLLSNISAMNFLKVTGIIEPGSGKEVEFVNQYLRTLICHEVGHTLGLRHNFKGSRGIPTDKLHDKDFTGEHGTCCSVMDYDVANIAPPGVKQGYYWSPSIGAYDFWAIEYGYSILDAETPEDELPALGEIASYGARQFHAYGTDPDAHTGTYSMDPDCVAWDMGDDPFLYYEGSLANMRELWDKLEEYWDKPGTDYKWLRASYMGAFFEYWMAGRTIKRFVGSIKHNRYHIGDPNSEPPYVPTPGDVQRRALEFLDEHIWSENAFDFDPEMLNKLEGQRESEFDYSIFSQPHDFQVHANVLRMQGHTLTWIYDPVVMTRLVDMRYKYPEGVEPFYLEDMFLFVRDAIWKEIDNSRDINSFRRNLQRFHLNILLKMVIDPAPGTPDDARALARMDIVHIADAIDSALIGHQLDYMTRAHLSEVEARINAALSAGLEYPGYNWAWVY